METIDVVIGGNVTLTIPAKTRETNEFVTLLTEHMTEYVNKSSAQGECMSIGDFSLFLLVKASKEL